MSVQRSLLDDLNELQASYVEAINIAIAADDYPRADELAAQYDTDAIEMMAEREGKTHLLPLRRPSTPDTPLRRLARWLKADRAA
jgi:hypothetical protein